MFPGEASKTDLLQHLERKCQQERGWFHHPKPSSCTALQELVRDSSMLKASSVGSAQPLWSGAFWRDPRDLGTPDWTGRQKMQVWNTAQF